MFEKDPSPWPYVALVVAAMFLAGLRYVIVHRDVQALADQSAAVSAHPSPPVDRPTALVQDADATSPCARLQARADAPDLADAERAALRAQLQRHRCETTPPR